MNRVRFWGILLFTVVFSLPAAPPALRITSLVDGSVVPANWLHPLLEWEDDAPPGAEYTVSFAAGKSVLSLKTRERRLTPPPDQFLPLLGHPAITITVRRAGALDKTEARLRVLVARESFDDTVVYRLVEPLFNPEQDAVLNVLRLDKEEPESHILAGALCLGCHAYRNESAAFNVRRGTDRRFVANWPSGDTAGAFRDRTVGEFSFISISPDGRTLAYVTRTRAFIKVGKNYVEPFDMFYTAGDIALLKAGEAEERLLPGASYQELVEDMPDFSPDGKTLVFCRYAPNPGIPKLRPVALYTIPVVGGEAELLMKNPPSAWCYFPKYSPDGKWISFVAADASASYFARRTADIWLYSIEKGTTRKLECNREGAMDSWHAWSADGRWLVFSSNRAAELPANRAAELPATEGSFQRAGGLTALYLARVDEGGKAAPPVKISSDPARKANLPFVVKGAFTLDGKAGEFLRSVYPPPTAP